MAKVTLVQYVDDYDGKEIAEADVRKMSISFNGADFELEVSEANEKKIANKINPILANAQRVGGRKRRPAKASRGADQNRRIRSWANANGWTVSSRGAIPQNVIDAYETAES